jgi:hypothetical protein
MPRPSDENKIGQLYFIGSADQDAVKIGFATEVAMRLSSLQTGNPSELTFVASVPCTFGAEQHLHRMLKDHRLRLEWYRRDEFILALMDELQDAAFCCGWDVLIERYGNSPIPTSSFEEAAAIIDSAEQQNPLTVADIDRVIREVRSEAVS